MAAEAPAGCAHGIKTGKRFEQVRFFKNFLALFRWQEQKNIPHRIRPDDAGFHLRFLASARDMRFTSLCAVTRPARISASDCAIIF